MINLTEFQILCSIFNLSSELMERSINDKPDWVPDLVFHLEPLHFPLVGIIPENLHYHLQLSVIHSTDDYKENCYILVTIKILQNTERDLRFATYSDYLIPIFSYISNSNYINSVQSNCLSLNYQRFTPSGCRDTEMIKFKFVGKTTNTHRIAEKSSSYFTVLSPT